MDAHQKIFSPLAKQIEFFSRAQNLTCCDGLLAGLWRFKWSLSDYRLSTVNLLLCGFTITEEKTNKASQSVIGASEIAMRALRLWVTGRHKARLFLTPEVLRQRQTLRHRDVNWNTSLTSHKTKLVQDVCLLGLLVITYYANGTKCRVFGDHQDSGRLPGQQPQTCPRHKQPSDKLTGRNGFLS